MPRDGTVPRLMIRVRTIGSFGSSNPVATVPLVRQIVNAESTRHALIDYEATMKSIGNDRSLFETLAQIFLEDYPTLLNDLGQAVTGESHEAVYGGLPIG